MADNVATQSDNATASTNQYNNNTNTGQDLNNNPDNPFPVSPGTYFVGQYELWVKSSDNTVIDSPNGQGIGLTVDEWVATYGAGSTDYK